MRNKPPVLFFDQDDYELLHIVNDVLQRGERCHAIGPRIAAHMHPHGIKEMAASRGLRIAYAVIRLLESFETGQPEERLSTLRALRDEVLFSSSAYFQKNTARVLIQIMKELIRQQGNEKAQLQLAHDFRMASTGRPTLIRKELKKYGLFEMPEEWNQLTFDDRVHDAYTKGRKSPSHLIMDAWIKGIRSLTVVYYNFIDIQVAEELLEASDLLGVHTTIGIELSALFGKKYVQFTWELSGFAETQSLLAFLHEKQAQDMMGEGFVVSRYQQQYVLDVLQEFNRTHAQTIQDRYGLQPAPITLDEFRLFVGSGQPSLLHLARFIHSRIRAAAKTPSTVNQAGHEYIEGGQQCLPNNRTIQMISETMTPETIIREFLLPVRNPDLVDPRIPSDNPDVPDLLRLSPRELITKLQDLHAGANITLSLSNLTAQDALQILYECQGHITHLEIFNLKDANRGLTSAFTSQNHGFAGETVDIVSPLKSYAMINDLQKALNTDNVIALKAAVRAIIWDFESTRLDLIQQIQRYQAESISHDDLEQDLLAREMRKAELVDILYHLEQFHGFYRKRQLRSRIGSGSTGLYTQGHSMGLAVISTLPPKVQRFAHKEISENNRTQLPLFAHLIQHRYEKYREKTVLSPQTGLLTGLRSLVGRRVKKWREWSIESIELVSGQQGNIITLGNVGRKDSKAGKQARCPKQGGLPSRTYLNTTLKNLLKVLMGFIPAFLTFSLTKDWWVLAYLGAFIWFGITGIRNIIQAVLGGGGLRRSPLLPWSSLVSWTRISDSLLYTGFSVPLLDFLVKTVFLDQELNITTTTSPLILYSVMALANGLYIFSHNIFRGLPRSAAVGNLFRSLLSIPLAMLFNSAIGWGLQMGGVVQVDLILQKWAAVISKCASDCIAAIIEGLADRQANTRMRLDGYRAKLHQFFDTYSRLELLFPDEDILELLQSPKKLIKTMGKEARDLEYIFLINALDCMYFWLYQPRARRALLKIRTEMSQEEWQIFHRSQFALKRYQEISEMIVHGLIGKKFSKALSFYLGRYETYLDDLRRLPDI